MSLKAASSPSREGGKVGVIGLPITRHVVEELAAKRLLATAFFKPEVLKMGKAGQYMRELEQHGLGIALYARCTPEREFFEKHYEEHAEDVVHLRGIPINKRNMLVSWMMQIDPSTGQNYPTDLFYLTAREPAKDGQTDVPAMLEKLVGHSSNADKCHDGTWRKRDGGTVYAKQHDPDNPDAGYQYTLVHRSKHQDVVHEAMNFATQIELGHQVLMMPHQIIEAHNLHNVYFYALGTSGQ